MNSVGHRRATSERMKGNQFGKLLKGQPKSEEFKAKLRASWTPERKEANRLRMLGNKFSPHRKVGEFQHTPESKAKLSKARKGKIFRSDGLPHDDPKVLRARKLRYRYHFSPEIYEAKLEEQDGHCALCPATHGWHGRLLSVDHDHACCGPMVSASRANGALCGDCTRGLLCDNCNQLVGKMETLDEKWAERAAVYLAKWRLFKLTSPA
jgi:Recombination endonuclease VII/NUMOD3 motif